MKDNIDLFWEIFGVPCAVVIILAIIVHFLTAWVDYKKLKGDR